MPPGSTDGAPEIGKYDSSDPNWLYTLILKKVFPVGIGTITFDTPVIGLAGK
jgi:hypothetical protein